MTVVHLSPGIIVFTFTNVPERLLNSFSPCYLRKVMLRGYHKIPNEIFPSVSKKNQHDVTRACHALDDTCGQTPCSQGLDFYAPVVFLSIVICTRKTKNERILKGLISGHSRLTVKRKNVKGKLRVLQSPKMYFFSFEIVVMQLVGQNPFKCKWKYNLKVLGWQFPCQFHVQVREKCVKISAFEFFCQTGYHYAILQCASVKFLHCCASFHVYPAVSSLDCKNTEFRSTV